MVKIAAAERCMAELSLTMKSASNAVLALMNAAAVRLIWLIDILEGSAPQPPQGDIIPLTLAWGIDKQRIFVVFRTKK